MKIFRKAYRKYWLWGVMIFIALNLVYRWTYFLYQENINIRVRNETRLGPVDVSVVIDGSEVFNKEVSTFFIPLESQDFSLSPGYHTIEVTSKKADKDIEKEFFVEYRKYLVVELYHPEFSAEIILDINVSNSSFTFM